MRILVLIHEYPPIGGGGGQAAQDICEGLAARGDEVRVLTAQCGDLPAEEARKGVLIRRLRSGRKYPYKAGIFVMLAYVVKAIFIAPRLIHTWKPDVIHTHFAVPAGAAAFILSKLYRIPYVLTAHLGDVPGGVPEKTGRWFRWIYPFTPPIWRCAKKVVAVSQFTCALALKHYPLEIEVIPNGVDLGKIDPGRIRVNQPPCIVFAGRFVQQKNPRLIIKTLSKLKDLNWQCVLIGDGALNSLVAEDIQQAGLQERVQLTGWLNPAQVIEWYRRSDILFMPSLSEGLPLVGVQALAMGLALVLSDVGGNLELVVPGRNGFLVNPQDKDGFQDGLQTLLSDPKKLLAFKQASRELASRLDINAVVESYSQIFSAIVCAKKGVG